LHITSLVSSKRKNKNKQTRSKGNGRVAAARALPSPEQVVGAVLEAIAAPLLASGAESGAESGPDEESSSARSGVHAISPRLSPHQDHRAHTRVVVAVAVGLETESHFFAGLSGDVSEGGVFVQTYRDLPVGSPVEVQFDLPDAQLQAHGRVRWHRDSSDSSPPGVGIAFEELAEKDRRVIQRFCQRRAPLYYEVEHG
jgi:uncharacterized protein (TIGR02266 family)